MTIGVTFRNKILKLVYNGTPIPGIADNAAVSPLTSLYLTLHTAAPSDGYQSTNEAADANHVRLPVVRNGTGWIVTGNSVSPASIITFAERAGTIETYKFASVGTALSGAGEVIDYGALSIDIVSGPGVIPQIKTTMTITRT